MAGPRIEPFWQFLAEWLRTHDWTQTQLADKVGVHQTVVSKWLHADIRRRARPGRQVMAKLAEVLEVPLDQLLFMLVTDQSAAEQARGQARATRQASRAAETGPEDPDPIEQMIRARTEEMRDALRGVPPVFWATIINSTIDRAIGGARDMARLLVEAESAPGPISSQVDTEVSTPKRGHNKSSKDVDGDLLARELGALWVAKRPLVAAGMAL